MVIWKLKPFPHFMRYSWGELWDTDRKMNNVEIMTNHLESGWSLERSWGLSVTLHLSDHYFQYPNCLLTTLVHYLSKALCVPSSPRRYKTLISVALINRVITFNCNTSSVDGISSKTVSVRDWEPQTWISSRRLTQLFQFLGQKL